MANKNAADAPRSGRTPRGGAAEEKKAILAKSHKATGLAKRAGGVASTKKKSGSAKAAAKRGAAGERARRRIHEVPTLYNILPPKSPASGREFARIVNLLLFHKGRRSGRTVTLFDDRAGDVRGLDAYEEDRGSVTGYQHKFYPSPLSNDHRTDIKESLADALRRDQEAREENKKGRTKKPPLTKWILVTPDDLVESAARKDGGDVSWFEGLRAELDLPFEIEHWGHTQLQALFLETPSVGLYYYPELFPDGVRHRKTIQALRKQYDDAIKEEHSRIEFVGMSVYKEEAARTVPMESIYIPLRAIPNDADENDPNVQRQDPLEFLSPGSRHVVLGDPGSGKTTLLKFLALFGQSEPLQRRSCAKDGTGRFRFNPDDRLPVFVTLRRYADALKSDDNLSLIKYIRANIEADFSITGVTDDFLEYYLESGKALLLFDGLDELPNPAFKNEVRNRIRNLTTTYPGNTTIVTCRVYGYQGPFRFDERQFAHHRLGRLGDDEIEQFVQDWYDARLEKPHDRKEYLESLLAILRNELHQAIRDLARNPLLLTIMVLVHRIDAVLPDERHVLYHKCTETLLNTWHTWKFREMDRLHRAKVDQQNMQRMQAIAFWMHHEMGGENAAHQAVVSYEAIHKVLCDHIAAEVPPNLQYGPDAIATAFLEFVQDRAGLLVEIGDRQFSFVHLTFQEYLTAARIKTLAELNGVRDAWRHEIEEHCPDPRWREVIRLLVAAYAQDAQSFLFDSIVGCPSTDAKIAQLLGGLLLDGVSAAVMRKEEVFRCLLLASSATGAEGLLKETLGILRSCRGKADADGHAFHSAARSLATDATDEDARTRVRLATLAAGTNVQETWRLCGRGPEREAAVLSLFGGLELGSDEAKVVRDDQRLLTAALQSFVLTSTGHNLVGVALQPLAGSGDSALGNQAALDVLWTAIVGWGLGPLPDYCIHTLLFSTEGCKLRFALSAALDRDRARARARDRDRDRARARDRDRDRARNLALALALDRARARARDRDRDRDRALARDRDLAVARARDLALARARDLDWDCDLDRALNRVRDVALGRDPAQIAASERENAIVVWRRLIADPEAAREILAFVGHVFDLYPAPLWGEALANIFLPSVPERFELADSRWWRKTRDAFQQGEPNDADVLAAAWQLTFDGVLYTLGYHQAEADWLRKELEYTNIQIEEHQAAASESQALFTDLANLTREREDPRLRIAHCLRDLCYGDESRADDLKAMVQSSDPAYREIFERCCWRPTKEEARMEDEEERRAHTKKETLASMISGPAALRTSERPRRRKTT